MLKLIQEECVENRGWLTAAEFSSLLGVSYVFPGLTAVKLSALSGVKVAGVPGMVAGVLALNLPGLVLAFALYGAITRYQDAAWLRRVLLGMQYGALALLAAALWALGAGVARRKDHGRARHIRVAGGGSTGRCAARP